MHIQIAIAIIYLQEEEMQVPLLQLTFDEGASNERRRREPLKRNCAGANEQIGL